MNRKYNLLTIGNAVIDILAKVNAQFIIDNKLNKGVMKLINKKEIISLNNKINKKIKKPGGSAANTAIGYSSLGGKVAYIGTIAKDKFGDSFNNKMKKAKVAYNPIYIENKSTSHSIILITPDGERTMNTYLDASLNLSKNHIDKKIILQSDIIYFEGYLWYQPLAITAFNYIKKITKNTNIKIAISLSDTLCVKEFKNDFKKMIKNKIISIVFGNENEIKALYEVKNFEDALKKNSKTNILTFITRGSKGAIIQKGNLLERISVNPVNNIIDLTGAGDIFAAGVLYGIKNNLNLIRATKLGCIIAREIIQHIGSQPKLNLLNIIKKNNFKFF